MDYITENVKLLCGNCLERMKEIPDKSVDFILGDLPRIELFARQSVDGWDCWGNEAPEDN